MTAYLPSSRVASTSGWGESGWTDAHVIAKCLVHKAVEAVLWSGVASVGQVKLSSIVVDLTDQVFPSVDFFLS